MASHKQIPDSPEQLRRHKVLVHDLSDTGKELNATNVNFLKIDVETALTFSGLALKTDNEAKRKRNRHHARRAYDTILRLWDSVTFTPDEEAYMHNMIAHLKNDLEMLGEKFE
jgi:hypothetical protein